MEKAKDPQKNKKDQDGKYNTTTTDKDEEREMDFLLLNFFSPSPPRYYYSLYAFLLLSCSLKSIYYLLLLGSCEPPLWPEPPFLARSGAFARLLPLLLLL